MTPPRLPPTSELRDASLSGDRKEGSGPGVLTANPDLLAAWLVPPEGRLFRRPEGQKRAAHSSGQQRGGERESIPLTKRGLNLSCGLVGCAGPEVRACKRSKRPPTRLRGLRCGNFTHKGGYEKETPRCSVILSSGDLPGLRPMGRSAASVQVSSATGFIVSELEGSVKWYFHPSCLHTPYGRAERPGLTPELACQSDTTPPCVVYTLYSTHLPRPVCPGQLPQKAESHPILRISAQKSHSPIT